MGTPEMQAALLPGITRSPDGPAYVYAVQGHSNTCQRGGAPELEDMLEIPGFNRLCVWCARPATGRRTFTRLFPGIVAPSFSEA